RASPRPATLTRAAYALPWVGARRAPLAAPLALLLAALLLITAVVLVGSQLVQPRLTVIAPAPSNVPTFAPSFVPSDAPTAPAGPLGGGPIVAYTYTKYRDPGPYTVVAVDAGTGRITQLGSLPAVADPPPPPPYSFL